MIRGKDILVYIEKDGRYIATACDRECTLNIQSEFQEVVNKTSGYSRSRIPTLVDWSISGDGLADYGREISALYMQTSILQRRSCFIRMFVKAANGYAIFSGYGYFQQCALSASYADVAQYQYTILGDGKPTLTSTIPQDADENELLEVLAANNNDLIIDNNENLIITSPEG